MIQRLDRHTGLVLEGGGMRGVFTSGVLDAFMKYELYFPYVVAVSAGACNGLSYMSRQPRRARYSNIDMLRKYGYISLKNLLVQGCIFDPNILYERFPAEIVPSTIRPTQPILLLLRWSRPTVLQGRLSISVRSMTLVVSRL